MTEYGVQTNNIFDLLNAADDAARPAAQQKARTKKGQGAKPAPGGAKKDQGGAKPAQSRPASSKANTTTITVSGGRGSAPRGASQQQGGNAPAPARNSPAQTTKSALKPTLARGTEEFVRRHDESHVSFAEEKGKPNNARHEGAPAVKHNPPNRGREFDRQSGSGRSPTENKKGGAGQGNWGKTSADEELAAAEDAKAELAAGSPEAQKEEKKNKKKKKGKKGAEEEEETDKKDEIPDEQLRTFDDFLKEQATRAVKLSLPPARAAGEGVKADPKWAAAVKREDQEEVFLKPKEEPKPKANEPEDEAKLSKSAMRKRRKKEAKQAAAKKLAEQNITNMFDFSAKKENDFAPRRGPREGGNRGPREGGNRGPREGGNRGPREGGNRGPREGGNRGPREGGNRGPREQGGPRGGGRNVQPRKYNVDAGDAGPQFDASAFPALQVGPPPITVD